MTRMFSRGFTLMEMLVVIGIISLLIGVSVGGYTKMTKTAEKTKAQELVANTATALTVLFNKEGSWPRRLLTDGKSDGRLDKDAAYVLAKAGVMSLTTEGGKLDGVDRFGIVTPWASTVLKRLGTKGALASKVGSCTVQDHILHFAVDIDGDGLIEGANVGGENLTIRATAAVWCIGKSGGDKGSPWPYSKGLSRDDVYSWTREQVKKN